MFLPEVSVLVDALRPLAPRHEISRRFLLALINSQTPFAVTSTVLAGAIRVCTNRTVFPAATPVVEAVQFCQVFADAPFARRIEPGELFLSLLGQLLSETGMSGGDVSDGFLAAVALEHGCIIVTWDRDFLRFKNLEVLTPEAALRRLNG
jgi:toxin-antitoxin system PIN domain toxin